MKTRRFDDVLRYDCSKADGFIYLHPQCCGKTRQFRGFISRQADLPWCSCLMRHRSRVREALGSNPGDEAETPLKCGIGSGSASVRTAVLCCRRAGCRPLPISIMRFPRYAGASLKPQVRPALAAAASPLFCSQGNRIRLERASQNQSSDTPPPPKPYGRVKRCWELSPVATSEKTTTQRQNGAAVPLMWTYPFSDWLRKALETGLVFGWLLSAAKGPLLAGLPTGDAVLTRRTQQEPATREKQGETECTVATHERASSAHYTRAVKSTALLCSSGRCICVPGFDLRQGQTWKGYFGMRETCKTLVCGFSRDDPVFVAFFTPSLLHPHFALALSVPLISTTHFVFAFHSSVTTPALILDPVYRFGLPNAYKINMATTALPSRTIPPNLFGGSKSAFRGIREKGKFQDGSSRLRFWSPVPLCTMRHNHSTGIGFTPHQQKCIVELLRCTLLMPYHGNRCGFGAQNSTEHICKRREDMVDQVLPPQIMCVVLKVWIRVIAAIP
ncbi:hypothetical protein PR048_010310 [Dryococelus australis]|uniref:Uncharacterized protein n=1 Tax=Dryococelus australis TaxID=614101 RepID=A0ABQ9I2D5_9NEOP|nr:hypothetical protein PR048_010310 [Dryococelus australis]